MTGKASGQRRKGGTQTTEIIKRGALELKNIRFSKAC
jgi:hypothetical protein